MSQTIAFINNLFGQDMIVIFLIILILFGAKKLPELARGIGKSMGEFKRARDEFERDVKNAETETTARDNQAKPATSPAGQNAPKQG